jgi:hypothetical protein
MPISKIDRIKLIRASLEALRGMASEAFAGRDPSTKKEKEARRLADLAYEELTELAGPKRIEAIKRGDGSYSVPYLSYQDDKTLNTAVRVCLSLAEMIAGAKSEGVQFDPETDGAVSVARTGADAIVALTRRDGTLRVAEKKYVDTFFGCFVFVFCEDDSGEHLIVPDTAMDAVYAADTDFAEDAIGGVEEYPYDRDKYAEMVAVVEAMCGPDSHIAKRARETEL